MKLESLLQQMIDRGRENARRLPGGLGLRYTPPKPGDLPPLHVLSLSRRDYIDPGNDEVATVHRALAAVRPAATKVMMTRSQVNDMMIRRISWREDLHDEPAEPEEEAHA